jgi:hypothetical protein
VVLFLAAGCQTERVTTSDGWPLPPDPRPAPMPPDALKADCMVFMVGSKPDDTNNNGFPDTIRASVALFSAAHPTALRDEGAFVFTLYPQGRSGTVDAAPIAQWRFEGEALQHLLRRTQYGPCYQFTLSMLDPAASPDGDRRPLDRGDIVCRFEPADPAAAPVTSSGVRSIQIGSRLMSDA